MYLIRNKALDDNKGKLTVNIKKTMEEETIIRLSEKFEVPITFDKESGETNWKIQSDLLKSRLAINWAVNPVKGDNFKQEVNKKIAKVTTNVKEYYEIYKDESLGLANLLPGDEEELRGNTKYAEALIQSGFANKIKITDLETNQVIWDGGEVEFDYEVTNISYDGKKIKETLTGKKIANLIHPKKERALYFKPKAKAEVKESTIQDLIPTINE